MNKMEKLAEWARCMGCAEVEGDITVYKDGEFVRLDGKTISGQMK